METAEERARKQKNEIQRMNEIELFRQKSCECISSKYVWVDFMEQQVFVVFIKSRYFECIQLACALWIIKLKYKANTYTLNAQRR